MKHWFGFAPAAGFKKAKYVALDGESGTRYWSRYDQSKWKKEKRRKTAFPSD
jgi:hypothetical protein